LERGAARFLPAGAEHYSAYVGPPEQYDFMGATQFRLLTALGLREHHRLLDFGCGSLRAGRLLIPYLLPGHYFGLEPNQWLIEDAIRRELGPSIIALRRPVFRHEDDFDARHFGATFDFILAQSIFSHAGRDIVCRALEGFAACLNEDGLVLATFIFPEDVSTLEQDRPSGWVYPACVAFHPSTVLEMVESAGLAGRRLPWFHPRQVWFALARRREQLPMPEDDRHLSGVVLRDPTLAGPR
jgi:cyclopropane fatty-acyl-phospholipid synthase-like methyltransferase